MYSHLILMDDIKTQKFTKRLKKG